MKRGLPKAYIKKWGISKTAWRKFRAGALTSGIRTRTRAIKRRLKGKNPKRRVRRTARKKRKSRRYSMTIPLAPIVGLLAGMKTAIPPLMAGDLDKAIGEVTYSYVGIDGAGRFSWAGLQRGLVPLIIGLLVHKFVGGPPLNLNRVLARAKVPFIRI